MENVLRYTEAKVLELIKYIYHINTVNINIYINVEYI